jgi:predicted TIM-barrel fold metal-dependent hydrolase
MEIREQAFAGKPINALVIDAHTHILGYCAFGWYQSFRSNAEIVAHMDQLGINCIVTAPHSMVYGDIELTNETAAAAAKEFPGRIYGYIFVRPQQGLDDVRKTLEKYSKDKSFIGLKLLAGYHGPLACPEYDYAIDFAVDMKCPVLTHTWANSPTMTDIERAVKRCPDLKLIVAHLGGGEMEMTNQFVQLMKKYPNLSMEICGSLYNQYSIEEIVEMAGEDRVIYGSDLINLDPRFDFGRIVFSMLNDTVKKKLLARNYLKLLQGSLLGTIT